MEKLDLTEISKKFDDFFKLRTDTKLLNEKMEEEKRKVVCKEITDAYVKTILKISEKLENKKSSILNLNNEFGSLEEVNLKKFDLKKYFRLQECRDLSELNRKIQHSKIPIVGNFVGNERILPNYYSLKFIPRDNDDSFEIDLTFK